MVQEKFERCSKRMVNQWFTSRKRSRGARKLRDALIDAAERTIASEGLRGMKARELAYKVGCAVGAIYNVVRRSRRPDLRGERAHAGAARKDAHGRRRAGIATRRPTRSRALTHLALAYTDYAAANRPRWRALFDHRLPEGARGPDLVHGRTSRACSSISRSRCASSRPRIAHERRTLLARSLFSAVHGIVLIGLEEKLQSIPLRPCASR